jgi:DNA-binding protein HU-beta
MNKAELIEAVAKTSGATKAEVGRIMDALFSADGGVIAKALKKGERIQITGFGTFDVRKRAARKGRNPRTGESIKIKASKNPVFKAGKSLKDAV